MDNVEVLPSVLIAPDVVGIDCVVRVIDLRTEKKKRYTIVPAEFGDMAKRLPTVTTPLGIALLGITLSFDGVCATNPSGPMLPRRTCQKVKGTAAAVPAIVWSKRF